MANAMRAVRKNAVTTLPRGMVITVLALMSWGLVLAGWKSVTLSVSLLFG